MWYRDFEIINKWWNRKLSIVYNGKELLFDTLGEVKCFIDDLY